MKTANMRILFDPESVAVIGASDKSGKLGFHVMKSLTKGGFPGKIIPINPGSREIMGIKASPSIAEYDGQVDLAIVVVPSKLVPGVFRECVDKDVKGIVLITAGFKEIEDPVGALLHEEIAGIANDAGIPVIGPNTFGMINFHADLNASFTPEFSRLRRGGVTLVSQSGGISHLLGFMAIRLDVGFSKIIGLGNRLNVDFAQMVDYLMDDPDTKVIMLYMEGIDDPRQLIETIKRHRGKKPVIINKTGSSEKGDQASRSHTGSMAGRHEVYLGAFNQSGMLTIDNTETLLDAAKALAASPLPDGPGIAVLSGQAGPGMAACDVSEALGLELVDFGNHTQERINDNLPPLALRTNPVDMGPAWYDPSATGEIIKAVMDDEHVNGILLLIMFASANVDVVKGISSFLIDWGQRKPLITCISGPPGIWDEEIELLERSGAIVNYPTPERAASAMASLWKYKKIRDRIE
ncbi:MAG: CoA-binding protein [Thermodesulfobacteriota bacterium]|nr:CoA-binding protein [Thermodesulfobacteriota bacterium]